ncbi:hypothetical protein J2W99_005094 [Bosea robiniae]|uniref:hypothetical protein n=1 Tax=Bosea TaxID=85413 RepID=UPI00285D2370|nr:MULTISPECIES: hypothetical protein [Bosea]MDR6831341.1 hypothetical protein [Bosea robiniae]MDR6898091.1 hypothetical protein [Bosea sp. BE109]MDR7141478.1 hypothetical protein [Bosea sp. BE168]
MPRLAMHRFRGTRYSTAELAEMSGVPANVLRGRLRSGWTIEQAMTVPTIQQRRRGVVSNFPPVSGTGAGSTAQETPEITFSEEANS